MSLPLQPSELHIIEAKIPFNPEKTYTDLSELYCWAFMDQCPDPIVIHHKYNVEKNNIIRLTQLQDIILRVDGDFDIWSSTLGYVAKDLEWPLQTTLCTYSDVSIRALADGVIEVFTLYYLYRIVRSYMQDLALDAIFTTRLDIAPNYFLIDACLVKEWSNNPPVNVLNSYNRFDAFMKQNRQLFQLDGLKMFDDTR